MSTYVFDEKIYELQTKRKVFKKVVKPYVILIILIANACKRFQPRFSNMHIDLDKINES